MMKRLLTSCTFVFALLASSVNAADWGDLSLTFQLAGPVPAAKKVDVNKDQAFCGPFNLLDESLVVNAENKGIQNIVVFLYVGRNDDAPAVHPDYAETAADKITFNNEKCRFEPHVCFLRTSQTLLVGNKDQVGHNTKVDTFTNTAINPIIPAGAQLPVQMAEAERLPAQVSCSIHPWMTSWLVIKDHPYMGASDKDGKITIKNVPAGEWTFQVWHEKSGYVREVTIDGSATEWSRGRFETQVASGSNDIGIVKVPAAAFEDN